MPPAETSPVKDRTDAAPPARLLVDAARRPDPLHALPALLPHGRRSGGLLLHPPEPRRQAGAARLRALDRVRDRSDREEAAQPFLPGDARAQLRHGGLQPRLQVLPELGHLEGASSTTRACAPTRPTRSSTLAVAPGRAVDRLHLQRSGDLGRVRHRHRARGARGAACKNVLVTAGYVTDEARARAVRRRRRRQRRPQGVHRGVLPQDDGVAPRARARDAQVDPPQERHLARGDDAADPRAQRQRRRARAASRPGSPRTWAPTCRCTSPRSIPTSR